MDDMNPSYVFLFLQMPHLRKTLTHCMLLACLLQVVYGEALQPLSDAEADAIILTKEQSTASRKAARRAELDQAPIKSEGQGVLANGQKVIIREVEPPTVVGAQVVEPAPSPAATNNQEPTPEQLAQLKSFSQRETQTLMLSATVYDESVTRLNWRHETTEYLVYTNANFNFLRGTHCIEDETVNFTFFMGIGNATCANNPYANEVVPDISAFSEAQSEYVLVQGDHRNADALASIEALLAHYDANLPELKIATQRRKALSAAQERYNAKHPKQPEEFLVQFWVPEPTERKADE